MASVELLANLAQTFASVADFDTQITSALAALGEFTRVSRVYVSVNAAEEKSASRLYEWCAGGIESRARAPEDLTDAVLASFGRHLADEGHVCVDDVSGLRPDQRERLSTLGIRSLVIYPMLAAERIVGSIGFDECGGPRHWQPGELNLLTSISGIISTAYVRKLSQDRLRSSEDNLRMLFDTIGDLLIVGDVEGHILHANRSAIDRLGYSLAELREMEIGSLHPTKKREQARRVLAAMFQGAGEGRPLELETRDGRVFPVETRVWLGQWDGRPCIYGVSKDLSKEREALQKFTALFEGNPALMAISGVTDGRFTEVNDSFLERLGYLPEEVLGRTSAELGLFVHSTEQRRFAAQLAAGEGRFKDLSLQVRCKDGRILDGLVSGEVIDVLGQEHFVSVMVDVTEQVALAAKVERQRRRLENIIASSGMGTWEWNVQTGATIFNDRWAEIAGYTLAELQPLSIQTWTGLVHPEDLKRSNDRLRKHFEGEVDHYECETRMHHKSGGWVWVLGRGRVIERGPDGLPLVMFGTHIDITEKKELEQRVLDVSIRDPLTNAYNRRYLFERLGVILTEYQRHEKPSAVAIIDLDFFKRVNDQHGHQAGDLVLREFARVIARNLRPYDLLGRYGGEEFVVVFANATKDQAARRVERMLESQRHRTFAFGGAEIAITFSGGVADCRELGAGALTSDRIIELADGRLYRAKQAGRDRIVWRDEEAG
jgi:diguanylate cyclase (GGDEF)-like protein/PAS domain S-box-containing protein